MKEKHDITLSFERFTNKRLFFIEKQVIYFWVVDHTFIYRFDYQLIIMTLTLTIKSSLFFVLNT